MKISRLVLVCALGVAGLSLGACGRFGDSFGGAMDREMSPETREQLIAGGTLADPNRETLFDLFTNADDPNVTVEVNRYLWNASLEILELSGCRLRAEGAKWLGDAVAKCASLRRLGVSRNSLGDKGVFELTSRGLDCTASLEALDLRHNAIGPEGAKRLKGSLERRCVTVRVLELEGNKLEEEETRALAETARRERARPPPPPRRPKPEPVSFPEKTASGRPRDETSASKVRERKKGPRLALRLRRRRERRRERQNLRSRFRSKARRTRVPGRRRTPRWRPCRLCRR